MSDLEQRIKEAAKQELYGIFCKTAEITALLAEKDAEIERLTRERDEWKLMTRRYQLHFGATDLKEPRP